MNIPENLTLMKRNNILKMVITNKKSLSIDALKIYNFIYMSLQYNRKNQNGDKIFFTHEDLIDKLKIKNKNYIPIIKTALKELITISVTIKNFINEDGNIVKENTSVLIYEYEDYEDKSGKKYFSASISETLRRAMLKNEKEYTLLSLDNINSLSSGNHIRLYEFVKSYQNMKIAPEYSLEDLNELFMTDFRFLAEIERIIKRAIKSINKNTDIELSYEKNKKRKTITYNIIKQKKTTEEELKQKFAISKNIEEKEIIDNLMNV